LVCPEFRIIDFLKKFYAIMLSAIKVPLGIRLGKEVKMEKSGAKPLRRTGASGLPGLG
jgi:hypothetical protein